MRSGSREEDIGLQPVVLDKDESVAVCARCHMDKTMLSAGYLTGDDVDGVLYFRCTFGEALVKSSMWTVVSVFCHWNLICTAIVI